MPELKPIIAIFAFIFGAVFASFGGVIAYRVPKKQSIIKPDSYCPSCNNSIKAYDNIPILSWLSLGGKCRYCKAKIGVFSLLCEIFGGFGFMSAFLMYGDRQKNLPIMVALICLVFLFIIMASIDYETHNIYNLTLIIFATLAIFIASYRVFVLEENLWNYLGGAALGFVFLLLIGLIAKFIMKREALGSGDVFIVGIGGLLLGVFPLLIAIMISSLIGSIVELTKIKLNKQSRENEIAFGPYLLLGIGFMAIYGEALMDFYWKVVF